MREPENMQKSVSKENSKDTQVEKKRYTEVNLQIDSNLTKVHRAMINCISTEQSSFAFLAKTIFHITISFPQVTGL